MTVGISPFLILMNCFWTWCFSTFTYSLKDAATSGGLVYTDDDEEDVYGALKQAIAVIFTNPSHPPLFFLICLAYNVVK